MTEPIKVYPTETPGLYKTEDGRDASRFSPLPFVPCWCCDCTQILSSGEGPHWRVGHRLYCHHCVQVVGEAVVP